MHIDLARSRQLTAAIDRAYALGKSSVVARLQRRRAKIDDRFNPRKALAATVRYLQLARQRFGRADLAVVSYHMGIGNLQHVLDDYDGGHSVPYVQLYFDTAPDHNTVAYRLLASFSDDSRTYYWRVLASLQTATDSTAEVLHPPDLTRPFADPNALNAAYASHTVVPLPSNASQLGLVYDPGIGSLARRLGVAAALYRGLRASALDLLIELTARVRAISHSAAPLVVTSAVSDERYQRLLGISDPPAAGGWSFAIARRYVNRAQPIAFQSMLERLQALNVIAWRRFPSEIKVTVASDASRVIVDGP
jgi:hypothetical protein